MVRITDYRTIQKENGETFYALIVQGGIEAVKSKETDRIYFTARTATVASTFNEATCQSLVGTQFPGEIKRVEVEPYEYLVPETDEIITLSHRYQFIPEEESTVSKQVIRDEELVM